jgi:hypothetical protein
MTFVRSPKGGVPSVLPVYSDTRIYSVLHDGSAELFEFGIAWRRGSRVDCQGSCSFIQCGCFGIDWQADPEIATLHTAESSKNLIFPADWCGSRSICPKLKTAL